MKEADEQKSYARPPTVPALPAPPVATYGSSVVDLVLRLHPWTLPTLP